jgi:hypothetical protein
MKRHPVEGQGLPMNEKPSSQSATLDEAVCYRETPCRFLSDPNLTLSYRACLFGVIPLAKQQRNTVSNCPFFMLACAP